MEMGKLPGLCQSCGEQGPMRSLAESKAQGGKEPFCKCPPKKFGGPYVMPAGIVVRAIYETRDQADFRERCRLAGNAFIAAKDGLSSRWVRCGRGWRELPRGNAKRERIERAYTNAKRALTKLQRVCPHEHRSMFDETGCDVCHADIEAAPRAAVGQV